MLNRGVWRRSLESRGPRAQRGAVLAVALLLLAILTLLALGASNLTRSQGIDALAVQQRDTAFQAAEATLVFAERLVTAPGSALDSHCDATARCRVYRSGSVDPGALISATWWRDHAWVYSEENKWLAATGDTESVAARRGQFFVEELHTVRDSLAIAPDGSASRLVYYRVTARVGANGQPGTVLLQSTVARRFD